MKNQKKIKTIFSLAILIVVSLLVVIGFQLFNIIKTQNTIKKQNQTIHQLEQELDYYQNKNLDNAYEEIV